MAREQIEYSDVNKADGDRGKTQKKKFMFLLLNGSQYAIPLAEVREVLGLGHISPLPNMPSFFAGLINLRGKVVSAIDLRKSLNFTNSTETKKNKIKRPCIIITQIEDRMFGAIVDDVLEVKLIGENEIELNVQDLNQKEMFQGVIKIRESGLAPILNLNNALRINELSTLTTNLAA
jgi:purine-binding chemotaxis protein CheW